VAIGNNGPGAALNRQINCFSVVETSGTFKVLDLVIIPPQQLLGNSLLRRANSNHSVVGNGSVTMSKSTAISRDVSAADPAA